MLTIEERVKKGVAILLEYDSTWYKKIDLEKLDIGMCNKCILGQLFGLYIKGKNILKHIDRNVGCDDDYGFCTYPEDFGCEYDKDSFEALTAEWKRVINQLRVSENF